MLSAARSGRCAKAEWPIRNQIVTMPRAEDRRLSRTFNLIFLSYTRIAIIACAVCGTFLLSAGHVFHWIRARDVGRFQSQNQESTVCSDERRVGKECRSRWSP